MQDGRPEDADLTKTDPFIFYPDPRLNEPASARPVDAELLDIGRRLDVRHIEELRGLQTALAGQAFRQRVGDVAGAGEVVRNNPEQH